MAIFGIFGHLGRWSWTLKDGHPVPKMVINPVPVSPYIYRTYLYISEDGHPRYRSMASFGLMNRITVFLMNTIALVRRWEGRGYDLSYTPHSKNRLVSLPPAKLRISL